MRMNKAALPLNNLHLAGLCHASQATGELANHLFLPAPQLVEIDPGLAKGHAVICERLRLVHHTRNM